MRGGTSKGLVLRREDLPAERADWDAIFLSVMGSPDPYRRQLDGMGGGVSSLSKICVVGPSTREDADVDYTFAQVGIDSPSVDYSGNCGNMSSAVGLFALEEGMVEAPAGGEARVRIHNTNTGKVIHAAVPMAGGAPATTGDCAVDGVAGTAAPIRLEFHDPGGAKTGRLLPTGEARQVLEVPGLGEVEASLVDAANPCVFVPADALGMSGELPEELERDGLFLERMEAIRRAASVAMGIAGTPEEAARIRSVPFVGMVMRPQAMKTIDGRELASADMSIGVRVLSSGQPHRAVPITVSICLAIAIRIEGSVPNRLAAGGGLIRLAHPSGVLTVDAAVDHAATPAQVFARHGAVYRTARRLFEGYAFYRPRG
jgi:2-methylaconitate cis-trans-isomerase PrpF